MLRFDPFWMREKEILRKAKANKTPLKCDICGRDSPHFFLNQVKDETWVFGVRDVWVCHRCVDLPHQLLGFIADKCYNSMEICRLLNGFEADNYQVCYAGRKFSYQTRPERCNHKENGCVFWSLTVYNALKKLEQKGLIHSEKTMHYDNRKGKGKRLDNFRFWFIDREAYEKRVLKQKIEGYIQQNQPIKPPFSFLSKTISLILWCSL